MKTKLIACFFAGLLAASLSFSALAAYITVYGSGTGSTYQAARSAAISNGTLYCAAAGGYIAGVWLDSFVNETPFGWSVQVYNSGCYIPD